MPLDHLGVNVPDVAAAKSYYDGLMPLVSYEPFIVDDEHFSYQPMDGKPGTYLFFYGALEEGAYTRHRPGLQHLAFMVKTRAAVDAAHEWALSVGSEMVHTPRRFPEYHSSYYATFWLDPHGFMLEVVCHRDA